MFNIEVPGPKTSLDHLVSGRKSVRLLAPVARPPGVNQDFEGPALGAAPLGFVGLFGNFLLPCKKGGKRWPGKSRFAGKAWRQILPTS